MAAKNKSRTDHQINAEIDECNIAMNNSNEYACSDGKTRSGDDLGTYRDSLYDQLSSMESGFKPLSYSSDSPIPTNKASVKKMKY